MAGRWAETRPEEASAWLAGCTVPWWFAGGWALDLWLGRETRIHSDLEVGCFRRDLTAFLERFAGWDIAVARDKQLTPWRSSAPPVPPFSLWLRRDGGVLWDLEILVEEREGEVWHYRREPRTTLPVDRLTIDMGRWRVIAPEILLLYKAEALREKDRTDFTTIAPLLSHDARRWLREALKTAHPGHTWIADLE